MKLTFLAICSLLALILVGFLIATMIIVQPVAIQTLPVEVNIEDQVGVNLDTDKLYFGTVTPGSTATREVTLELPTPYFVTMNHQGDAALWTTSSVEHSVLEQATPILFTLHTPQYVDQGTYTGIITFRFYRPIARLFLS